MAYHSRLSSRLGSIALALTLVASTASTASAQTLDRAREEGVIRVGVGLMGTKPLVWQQEDGTYTGLEYELLQELIERLGIAESEYVVTEWSTLIPGLKSDRWDIVLSGMVKTEERIQGGGIAMSNPYFFVYDRIIVPEESEIAGVDDLEGKVLAATLGTTDSLVAHSLVDQGLAAEVRDFNNFTEPFMAMANGQADAVIFDQVTFMGQAEAMGGIKVVGEPLFYVSKEEWSDAQEAADYKLGGVGIGVRKEDVDLLEAINAAIEEMEADGTRQALFEKYGIWDETQALSAMMK